MGLVCSQRALGQSCGECPRLSSDQLVSPLEVELAVPQPSQCREWWVGFFLITEITGSLEPKWKHFAQVNIADIFMLSIKLSKQNENGSKSREKSYGNLPADSTRDSRSSRHFFLLCLGARPVGRRQMRPEEFWANGPCQLAKSPANPKGAI